MSPVPWTKSFGKPAIWWKSVFRMPLSVIPRDVPFKSHGGMGPRVPQQGPFPTGSATPDFAELGPPLAGHVQRGRVATCELPSFCWRDSRLFGRVVLFLFVLLPYQGLESCPPAN